MLDTLKGFEIYKATQKDLDAERLTCITKNSIMVLTNYELFQFSDEYWSVK